MSEWINESVTRSERVEAARKLKQKIFENIEILEDAGYTYDEAFFYMSGLYEKTWLQGFAEMCINNYFGVEAESDT